MSNQPLQAPWLSMDTAPTDGRLVRLLVSFEENAIDDGDKPFPTIGQNNLQNDGVDRWQFVGWCWTHDEFTDGQGTPLGWMPMTDVTLGEHKPVAWRIPAGHAWRVFNLKCDADADATEWLKTFPTGDIEVQPLYAAPINKPDLAELMREHRIAVKPEHEGQWHADLYGHEAEPLARAEGDTPEAAVHAVIAAYRSGSPAGQNLPQQEGDQ